MRLDVERKIVPTTSEMDSHNLQPMSQRPERVSAASSAALAREFRLVQRQRRVTALRTHAELDNVARGRRELCKVPPLFVHGSLKI
jgi:hypothetical protein